MGGASQTLPIDITKRFTITQLIKNAVSNYYSYTIEEGERPDTVAYKMYKNEKLDWLVLLVNEVQDPYFSWPLTYETLNNYIIDKYGSVSNAMNSVHHYEWIVSTKTKTNDADGETVYVPEIVIIVDKSKYDTLAPAARRAVSQFDYENNLNDQRRVINLIDPRYTQTIVDQYKQLFA